MRSREKYLAAIDGHRLRLTNLDKVMYPSTGTTKAEVIDYYVAVAPFLLPHLAGRPVTRKRWAEGVDGPVFFEKNLPPSAPEWLTVTTLQHRGADATYPVFENRAALAWAGQVAALELHVPQWRFSTLTQRPSSPGPSNPDRLVLDLDPGPGVGLPECVQVALLARDILTELGVSSLLPVTSGSKGLHLYAPLDGQRDADYVSAFARQLAQVLERERPDLVTSTMAKQTRHGKVFIDWSQNNGKKTTISPYSLRGVSAPQVAAPRGWEELQTDARQLTFTEVLDRVARQGDLLAPLAPSGGTAPTTSPIPATTSPVPLKPVGRAEFVAPMLATARPPGMRLDRDDGWSFEPKWDGHRTVAVIGDEVKLFSRNHRDITSAHQQVAEQLSQLTAGTVLDGELVAFDQHGRPSFGLMQRGARARFVAFDVLMTGGLSLLDRPQRDRRKALDDLGLNDTLVQTTPMFADLTLAEAEELALEHGLEGIVAKRTDSAYLPGQRSPAWIKVKFEFTQSVVIGGWRPGQGTGLASLLIGIPDDGVLRYAGRVGTGFTEGERVELAERLQGQTMAQSPFEDVPADVAKDARWTDPVLVGEVTHRGTTDSGILRHASWRGLRKDQEPKDVHRE